MPPAQDRPKTVFVADDDAGLVRLIERILRREGFVTASADSGGSAMAWLSKEHADLLLLDLRLQDGEGGQVITHLAEQNKEVPFIIITGQGDERVAVEMMKRGARDYLVKDAAFLDLLPTVVHRCLKQLDQERRLISAELASERSRALTQAVLNSLPALIAVLDSTGHIMDVNEPWRNELEAKDGFALAKAAIGANYLEICKKAGREGMAGAAEIAGKIIAVLESGRAEGPVEYVVAGKKMESWYSTAVAPLSGTTRGAVINHVDITDRKRLESEVLHITEVERQRVAADLHDGICQEFAGIGFLVGGLQRELKQARHRLAAKTKEIENAIQDAVAHTRAVARGLNAVVADGHGLMHALELLASAAAQNHRLECVFKCRHKISIDNPVAANELYRIAQEAVSNAIRHGKAKKVVVELTQENGEICLAISDDGTGLQEAPEGHHGMGLRVMHYRAGLIGGRLTVQGKPKGGTEVICSIPRGKAGVPDKD